MEQNCLIRPASATEARNDAPAISSICKEGFSYIHASGFVPEDLVAFCESYYSPSAIADDIRMKDRFYLVLEKLKGQLTEKESEITGCLRLSSPSLQLAKEDPGGIELSRFYIREEHRGGGWGRKMLAMAEARALEMGFKRCWLHVYIPNARAQEFYKSLGYEIKGKETLHYRNSHPVGFVMVKSLRV